MATKTVHVKVNTQLIQRLETSFHKPIEDIYAQALLTMIENSECQMCLGTGVCQQCEGTGLDNV